MKLAEQHAVRFLKVMTCNNIGAPLGMGLWEGVPLRTVVWLARPVADVRRVFYSGFHNDDPKQLFQSSLPIGRVLEDPPGEYPVILCYKLNGAYLSPKRGGPVRMLVPDAYGFKSVKWLKQIVLSNAPFANDTYAAQNNDIDSWLKTFARFLSYPASHKAGEPIPVMGAAQVGISGLTKVQYWLAPRGKEPPADDPYFTTAAWKDAQILAPPAPPGWGGGFPEGRLPPNVMNIDSSGRPRSWPLRYSLAHWAALVPGVPAGKYDLRCRTIDANGFAQPMPRPLPKSGHNAIETVAIDVAAK
jgi:DMSO/TMAO reductase YedYZ molybdopterin-dependent catalytic subunit